MRSLEPEARRCDEVAGGGVACDDLARAGEYALYDFRPLAVEEGVDAALEYQDGFAGGRVAHQPVGDFHDLVRVAKLDVRHEVPFAHVAADVGRERLDRHDRLGPLGCGLDVAEVVDVVGVDKPHRAGGEGVVVRVGVEHARAGVVDAAGEGQHPDEHVEDLLAFAGEFRVVQRAF